MSVRFYFFMLIGCVIMAGCGHEEKAPVNHTAAPIPALMDPFKFHKLMEVSPGQYYDVASWGRGSTNTGAFLILHSDSSAKKFTTTTGDLDGVITDVYNADMDADGNPEILIQAKGKDTTNYTNIYAFEFNDSRAQKLDFPRLSGKQKKGYRGGDNFYIEDGKLIREYPIYSGSGKDARVTGQKEKLEYSLRSNNFSVKELSKDTTSNTSDKNKTAVADKKPTEKKHTTKTKKAEKKHHKTEKHKKKHRRHHSNDDDE